MGDDQVANVALIGLGRQGRANGRTIVEHPNTKIVCVCDDSPASYEEFAKESRERGLEPPPYERDLRRMLDKYGDELHVAVIATPPRYHFGQSAMCLERGLHVLVEKPPPPKVFEAAELVDVCKRNGKILSVAFQGSFRPEMQEARKILGSGELGQVQTIQATVWQNWKTLHSNEWRLDPEIAVGGHLFDTGSHGINAVCHLAAEEFASLSAEFDYNGTPVEVNAAVRGRLRSGVLVSILATGNTAKSCGSDVRVYCSGGILRTTAWGDSLEILREQPVDWKLTGTSRDEGWEPVNVRESPGMWAEFLRVIRGDIPNPSPPEQGLRMALVWDAIKKSADNGGAVVLL